MQSRWTSPPRSEPARRPHPLSFCVIVLYDGVTLILERRRLRPGCSSVKDTMDETHDSKKRCGEDRDHTEPGSADETVEAGDCSLPAFILRKLGKHISDLPHVALPPLTGEKSSAHGRPEGAAPSPPHRRAERLGRYDLLSELGRGGVGVVYRVRDPDLGRDLALKMLRHWEREEPEILRRFVEEAQIGGQLQHPSIVPVHEMGLLNGTTPYFTMKLVKGETLAALLKRRRDPAEDLQRFLSIFERVAQTLAYAHSRGVLHRDLKPSNIMIGAFGQVQVMDWGLAKVLHEGGIHDERRPAGAHLQSQVTKIETIRTDGSGSDSLAGEVMGTPAYMSPEQARGQVQELDERSDVFGLGAILCEVLTGKPPYTGTHRREIHRHAAAAALDDAYERLAASGADAEIVDLARKCLSPDPRARPRDAGGVATVIRAYFDAMDEKARAAEVEAAEAQARAEGERKTRFLELVIAVVLFVAILVGGGVYAKLDTDRRMLTQRVTADAEAAIASVVDLRGQAKRSTGAAASARWSAVVAAAQRAVDLSNTEGVSREVRERASDLLSEVRIAQRTAATAAAAARRNQRMIQRLEDIRLIREEGYLHEAPDPRRERIDAEKRRDSRQIAAYEEAFGVFFDDLGTEWDAGQPEKMAEQIRETAVTIELVRALDHWALAKKRRASDEDGAGGQSLDWRQLLLIARLADTDTVRIRIRQALEREDPGDLKSLAKGLPVRWYGQPGEEAHRTGTDEVAPALTYDLLAGALLDAGEGAVALSLLQQAHIYHPGDFWIHERYATALIAHAQERYTESIPHLSAMVALRRTNPRPWLHYGAVLTLVGELDDAVSSLEEAVRLAEKQPELQVQAWRRLAHARRLTGDLAGAIAAYKNLIERTPDDLDASLSLAEALQRSGDLSGALDLLRKVAERQPGAVRAQLALGKAFLEDGRPGEALDPLRRGCRAAPKNAELHLELGIASLRSGSLREACTVLQRAVALHPDSARAHLMAAVAGARLGELDDAILQLEEAVCLNPEMALVTPPTVVEPARLPTADRAEHESLRLALRNAAESRRNDATLLSLLGVLNLKAGNRLEEAIPAFERALELNAGNCLALSGLGLSYLRQGRFDAAIETIDRCLAIDGKNRAAMNNRAVALSRQGRADDAVSALQAALRLDPQEPVAYVNLGFLLSEQNRFSDAQKAFESVISLDDHNVEAQLQLGRSMYERRRYSAALPVFRTARALAPQNQRALRDLGRTLGYLGRLDAAVDLLNRSLKLDPEDAIAFNALGRFQLQRGALDEAIKGLERARELDETLWQASLNLGLAHTAGERYPEALDAFRTVVTINPENDTAFSEILSLLKNDAIDLGEAVDPLVRELKEVLNAKDRHHPDAVEAFLLAWSRAPESLDPEGPLQMAGRAVEASGGRDPHALALLARVQRAAGAMAEAVTSLEDAARLPTAKAEIAAMLEEYRRAALPHLLTYASIEAALARPEALVENGAVWRYWRGTTQPSPDLGWTRDDFNDSAWSEGPSGFGYRYGGLEEGTLLEDMLGSYTTVYLRRRFSLPHIDRYDTIIFSVETGDRFLAYVNGNEIGGSETETDTAAQGLEEATLLTIPRCLLLAGENLVAVRGSNGSKEDVDFFLRPVVFGVPTVARDRDRFAAFRTRARELKASALLAYLDGRMFERAGNREEAVRHFGKVLSDGPLDPLPLERLVALQEDREALARVLEEVHARLEKETLRPGLLDRPPEHPFNVSPAPDSTIEAPAIVLRASPFLCFDKKVKHLATRWQIRAEGAAYSQNPTFDSVRFDHLTVLPVPAGLLLPHRTYFFRAEYWLGGGRKLDFSDETSFSTGDLPYAPVPFDLLPYFNRDVVGNPGDPENQDFHRGGQSGAFTVDGFDGKRTDDPETRGLPRDGRVGVHRLGDYDTPNVIHLTQGNKKLVRIAVPPGRYVCLRFLSATGFDIARIPVRCEYADGSTQEATVLSDDWRFGCPIDKLQDGSHPVRQGMRALDRTFKQTYGPSNVALFEFIVPASDSRELAAIALRPQDGFFTKPNTAFNLFAITGMKVLEKER